MKDNNNSSNIFRPQVGEIIKVDRFTNLEKRFTIRLKRDSLRFSPGQFIMVSILGIGEAPISLSSSPTDKGEFEICVRKMGSVTSYLHNLEVGDTLGIRGPYGNGFPVEEVYGKDLLFVAGGLGIIPLRSFIKYSLENRDRFNDILILYGAKNPGELLFVDELKEWGNRGDIGLKLTVDRPDERWRGHIGVITRLIYSAEINPDNTYAFIVGPPVMFKYVIMELNAEGITDDKMYLSLERHMKCGIGKCGHCQINNRYVCMDGPVFRYSQIKNLSEAL
ncbi:MAG: FAD/NAD(P)-binding protein [Nitrospinae bacterium]|nr:FAD/NAD(P)-binding protein [Nitrospinota bacterium]